MIVQDVLDLCKSNLSNLAVSKNDSALINMINLGIVDLYDRFNLNIRSEKIQTNSDTNLYNIKDESVSLLLKLYDSNGRELHETDVIDAKGFDYTRLDYKNFILNHPDDTHVYAVYKASPTRVSNPNDKIELPGVMIQALYVYTASLAHATVQSTSSIAAYRASNNGDAMYQKYLALVQSLEMQGYKVSLDNQKLSIIAKGYR